MSWLRLIRWTNLLIILLTQGTVWFCVIWQLHHQLPLLLRPLNFACLCSSTILIAAAGYIINDYFDIRIDRINKPDKMVLDKGISRRQAILSHIVLNTLALLLAGIVARQAGHYEWLLLQMACVLLLWFYSTHFKRQFVTGNFIVALLTGLTLVVLFLYEPQLYLHHFDADAPAPSGDVWLSPVKVIIVFTGFAFLMTWMREIVKDMEDMKGDMEEGCETMPIRWGLLCTSRFTQLLGLLTSAALAVSIVYLWYVHFRIIAGVSLLTLLLPLLVWMYRLPAKATTAHYAQSSRTLKVIMVAGIFILFLIYLANNQLISF